MKKISMSEIWINSHKIQISLFLIIGSIIGFLNINNYPFFHHDEGYFYLVSYYLAEAGRYGLTTGNGFQPFLPLVAIGPTLLVPISFVFMLGFEGIVAARFLPVIIWITGTIFIYFISVNLNPNKFWAFIFSLFYLVFLYPSGRKLLGETSAILFQLIALLYIIRTLNKNQHLSTKNILFISILIGLSVLTKNISIISISGYIIWIFLYAPERITKENIKLKIKLMTVFILGVLLPVLLWYFFQFIILDIGTFQKNLEILANLNEYAGGNIDRFVWSEIINKLSSPYFLLRLILFIFPLFIYKKENLSKSSNSLIFIIQLTTFFYLIYYIFFDIGWLYHINYIIPLQLISISTIFSSYGNDYSITKSDLAKSTILNFIFLTNYIWILGFSKFTDNLLLRNGIIKSLFTIFPFIIFLFCSAFIINYNNFMRKVSLISLKKKGRIFSRINIILFLLFFNFFWINVPIISHQINLTMNANQNETEVMANYIDSKVNTNYTIYSNEYSVEALSKLHLFYHGAASEIIIMAYNTSNFFLLGPLFSQGSYSNYTFLEDNFEILYNINQFYLYKAF